MAAPVTDVAQASAMEGKKDEKREVKWLKHYSSAQTILMVGDGDFSFSLSLATAFGTGENLVATSLDSYGDLVRKYDQAESNVMALKRMGATVLHDVNAKSLKLHTTLKMKQFDRIIFNFPHAGFIASEIHSYMIQLHKDLVEGFLVNARCLLQPYGEIHISHKTGYPYDAWNIEQLALASSLTMVAKVSFQKYDYLGYDNKRGDGAKCDRSFNLGDCCTFKFCMKNKEPEGEMAVVAALAKVNISQNIVTVKVAWPLQGDWGILVN